MAAKHAFVTSQLVDLILAVRGWTVRHAVRGWTEIAEDHLYGVAEIAFTATAKVCEQALQD